MAKRPCTRRACARSDLRTTLQDGERERERCRLFSFSSPSLLRNSRSPSSRCHFSLVMNPPSSVGSREPLAKQGESPKEGAGLEKVGSFLPFLLRASLRSLPRSSVGGPSGKPFAHLGLPSLFGGRRRRRLCRWWWSQATRVSPSAEERERAPLSGREDGAAKGASASLLGDGGIVGVGWRLLEE